MPSLSHFSFTLELEGLWDQGSLNDLTYLYRVLHGMQWILLHALPDFVTTQNHYSSCMIQPSDELQDSSQFHGHGPCHKCKVALWYKLFSLRTLQNLLMRMLIPFFLIFFFKGKKGILNVCPLEKVPTYVLICSENPFWWTLTTDWQWEFSNYTSLQL